MDKEFSIGDVVWLNSGGPAMTVVDVPGNEVVGCVYCSPGTCIAPGGATTSTLYGHKVFPVAALRDTDPGILVTPDAIRSESLVRYAAGSYSDSSEAGGA